MIRFVPLAGALLALPAAAEYNVLVPEKSEIRFVSKQMNVPVEGRFKRFSAQFSFDPAKPEAAKAQLSVDLNSIDTGSTEADTEVKTKAWFNIAVFPAATFATTGVKPLGGNRYQVSGKLTIKGRSQDLSAPFTLKQEGAMAVFEGAFPIKRLAFGIGEGPWADPETVADEVQVKVKLAATGAAPKK